MGASEVIVKRFGVLSVCRLLTGRGALRLDKVLVLLEPMRDRAGR